MPNSVHVMRGKETCHFLAKYRQKLLGEPGVLVEPSIVTPGGVRQRQDLRVQCQSTPPVPHRLGQILAREFAQMPILRWPTKTDAGARALEARQDLPPPGWRAFGTRRQIAAICVLAGK